MSCHIPNKRINADRFYTPLRCTTLCVKLILTMKVFGKRSVTEMEKFMLSGQLALSIALPTLSFTISPSTNTSRPKNSLR